MATYDLPAHRPGQVIGLLGGSFDPPHGGHVHLSKWALRRFGLDRVWWLVSPGNPLKARGPAPAGRRLRACRALLASDPRILASDFESQAGTRYTLDTLTELTAACPGLRFVWLMGADNLAQFHRWRGWEEILHMMPVGIIARPPYRIAARMSKTARIYRHALLPGRQSLLLPRRAAPALCFINVPMRADSSTALRASGHWPAQRPARPAPMAAAP